MIMAKGGGGGGGVTDHELLDNRRGVGENGEAWHLTDWQHEYLTGGGLYRRTFQTPEALREAYPADVDGAFAIVLSTGTFWYWSIIKDDWDDSGQTAPVGGVSEHNKLSGLQGGDPEKDEFFHTDEAGWEKIEQLKNNAPDKPYNVSPEDEAVDVVERQRFLSSDYYHPYGYEMFLYQIRFLDSGGNVAYDSGPIEQSVSMWQPNAGVLRENETYSWQVRYAGTNFVGGEPVWSNWSETTTFSTEVVWSDPSIAQPLVVHPGDGSTVTASTPTIITTEFDEGSGLTQVDGDFQIARDSGFTNIVDQGVGKNSYIPGIQLTRGAQHFARARHAGEDAGGVVTKSPWSPRVGFLVREFYRDTRIGFVRHDPAAWLFRRIGRGGGDVDLDAGYLSWHPTWASLEATREQLIDGQPMSSIQKLWMWNGVLGAGPYAGKRAWLIDTNKPTDAELAAGWHLYASFLSDDYGEQDFLHISRGLCTVVSNVAVAQEAGVAGTSANIANADAYTAARNTDPSDPLKRGWHPMFWYDHALLRILAMIENASLSAVLSRYVTSNETFHGIAISTGNTAASNPMVLRGLGGAYATPPGGSKDMVAISPRITATSGNVNVNDIMTDADGPASFHMGDYMLGKVDANGGVGSDATDTSRIPAQNAQAKDYHGVFQSPIGSTASLGTIGQPGVWQSATSTNLFKMCKYT